MHKFHLVSLAPKKAFRQSNRYSIPAFDQIYLIFSDALYFFLLGLKNSVLYEVPLKYKTRRILLLGCERKAT
jgi:hypothetical protein